MLALVLVVVLTESDETTSTMLLELRSRKFLVVLTIKGPKLFFFLAEVDETGGVVTFDGQILLFYYYCYVKKGLFSD